MFEGIKSGTKKQQLRLSTSCRKAIPQLDALLRRFFTSRKGTPLAWREVWADTSRCAVDGALSFPPLELPHSGVPVWETGRTLLKRFLLARDL